MGLLQRRYAFIAFIAVAAFVAFDINKHGNFKRSQTGSFLKECGVFRLGNSAYSKFRLKCQQAYWWCKQHLPLYLARARQGLFPVLLALRDVLYTVSLLLWNNVKIIFQYLVDKKPLAAKWFDYYTPGLWDAVLCWLGQVWSLLIDYATQLYSLILQYTVWCWTAWKELFTYLHTTHVQFVM